MNFISKKTSLVLLGVTALICSRFLFFFFKDPEGPNLLIVVALAAGLYVLSLLVYVTSLSVSKKFLLAVLIQILLATSIFFYNVRTSSPTVIPPMITSLVVTTAIEPVFTWRYEADNSLNGDGLPQTNVYLDASYSGKKVSKLIATVPGSCNNLPDKEKDSVLNSSVAQCYAAGYGDLFKVTKGDHSYLVMRKIFEEASPDDTPPVEEYKRVTEFPFSI